MPIKIKVGTSTKEVLNCNVKVGGEIKQVFEILTKVNGQWKRVWKGDFFDINISYSTTEQYREFEDLYDSVPNYLSFIGLEMSAYDTNGNLLARETYGTPEEPEVISSASYSVYDDDNIYASVNIYVDKLNSAVRYTISRETGNAATRIEVKVAKILLPN